MKTYNAKELSLKLKIKSKYYTIYIEGMQYGNLVRKTESYSEALKIYREMKQIFYLFKCNVVLDKHVIYDNGEEECTKVHKKEIGQGYDIRARLNQIVDILDDLDKMKRLYTATSRDSDIYISAFMHVMEEENTEDIPDSQLRHITRGVEEKGALRRISKSQTDYISNITQNLNSIRSNTTKCIDTCKKLDYLNNTEKAKENSKIKSQEYRDIIGI